MVDERDNNLNPMDHPADEPVVEDAIEVVPEDTAALQKDLEESRSKANEYLEGWQRARAEFANYKKRIDRDQAMVYQNAAGSILKRYIEILDDLERALNHRPKEGEGAAWSEGIELIYRKFLAILESEGVKRMEVQGQMFDPNLHEAIGSEQSDDHQSGQIIEVLQNGYMLGDRVLRPALVRVAA
ncbi:MAG TPA: nucleotide exchange factor GrpE [Anaerolineales bacterium]